MTTFISIFRGVVTFPLNSQLSKPTFGGQLRTHPLELVMSLKDFFGSMTPPDMALALSAASLLRYTEQGCVTLKK